MKIIDKKTKKEYLIITKLGPYKEIKSGNAGIIPRGEKYQVINLENQKQYTLIFKNQNLNFNNTIDSKLEVLIDEIIQS
jgi:hypothetical protein